MLRRLCDRCHMDLGGLGDQDGEEQENYIPVTAGRVKTTYELCVPCHNALVTWITTPPPKVILNRS